MTRVWIEILPLGVGELRMANNFLSLVLNLYAPSRKINHGKLNPTWTGIDWPKLNKADRGGPAKPNFLAANSILLEFLPGKWTADAILKRLGQSASQTLKRNTSSRQTSISDTHTHMVCTEECISIQCTIIQILLPLPLSACLACVKYK